MIVSINDRLISRSPALDKMPTSENNNAKYLESRIPYIPPQPDHNLAKDILQSLQLNASHTLIVDSKSRAKWTGQDILEASGRIAGALVNKLHLRPGHTVLVTSDHSDRELLTALGIFLAGCAFVPNDPNDGLSEVKTMCDLVAVKAIATDSRHHQLAVELRKSAPELSDAPIIWINSQKLLEDLETDCNNNNSDQWYRQELIQRDEVILLDDILTQDELDMNLIEHIANDVIVASKHPAYYVLTSGSTGYPKAVEVNHEMCIHSIQSVIQSFKDPIGIQKVKYPLLTLTRGSVLAADLPIDHGATITLLLPCLQYGIKLIIIPPYEVHEFWRAVNDFHITHAISGTSFVYKLLEHLKALPDHSRNHLDLSSMESIICIGSHLKFSHLVKEIREKYPRINVTQGYGCTEIGYISTLPVEESREYIHTVGYLMPGVKGKVVDLNDPHKVLGPNERGELHVWARSKFDRYLCRHGIDSREVYDKCHDFENFYRTGDLVHYDKQGRIHIHGRIKETLTLAQDWKIMPAELESLVDEHPLVEASAVIGIPNSEVLGLEKPRAFVKLISIMSPKYEKLKSLSLTDEASLKLLQMFGAKDIEAISRHIYQYAADRTSSVKHLKGGVFILESFPTNGRLKKVDRKLLRLLPVE